MGVSAKPIDAPLDPVDFQILDHLQRDGDSRMRDMAKIAGISLSECWRRIHRMRVAGVIRKRVALLDAHRLDLGIVALVDLQMSAGTATIGRQTQNMLAGIPEVVEAYHITGSNEMFLKLVLRDIDSLDSLCGRLRQHLPVQSLSTRICVAPLKYSTELPLYHDGEGMNSGLPVQPPSLGSRFSSWEDVRAEGVPS